MGNREGGRCGDGRWGIEREGGGEGVGYEIEGRREGSEGKDVGEMEGEKEVKG